MSSNGIAAAESPPDAEGAAPPSAAAAATTVAATAATSVAATAATTVAAATSCSADATMAQLSALIGEFPRTSLAELPALVAQMQSLTDDYRAAAAAAAAAEKAAADIKRAQVSALTARLAAAAFSDEPCSSRQAAERDAAAAAAHAALAAAEDAAATAAGADEGADDCCHSSGAAGHAPDNAAAFNEFYLRYRERMDYHTAVFASLRDSDPDNSTIKLAIVCQRLIKVLNSEKLASRGLIQKQHVLMKNEENKDEERTVEGKIILQLAAVLRDLAVFSNASDTIRRGLQWDGYGHPVVPFHRCDTDVNQRFIKQEEPEFDCAQFERLSRLPLHGPNGELEQQGNDPDGAFTVLTEDQIAAFVRPSPPPPEELVPPYNLRPLLAMKLEDMMREKAKKAKKGHEETQDEFDNNFTYDTFLNGPSDLEMVYDAENAYYKHVNEEQALADQVNEMLSRIPDGELVEVMKQKYKLVKTYECKSCKETFETQHSFAGHVRRVHPKSAEDIRKEAKELQRWRDEINDRRREAEVEKIHRDVEKGMYDMGSMRMREVSRIMVAVEKAARIEFVNIRHEREKKEEEEKKKAEKKEGKNGKRQTVKKGSQQEETPEEGPKTCPLCGISIPYTQLYDEHLAVSHPKPTGRQSRAQRRAGILNEWDLLAQASKRVNGPSAVPVNAPPTVPVNNQNGEPTGSKPKPQSATEKGESSADVTAARSPSPKKNGKPIKEYACRVCSLKFVNPNSLAAHTRHCVNKNGADPSQRALARQQAKTGGVSGQEQSDKEGTTEATPLQTVKSEPAEQIETESTAELEGKEDAVEKTSDDAVFRAPAPRTRSLSGVNSSKPAAAAATAATAVLDAAAAAAPSGSELTHSLRRQTRSSVGEIPMERSVKKEVEEVEEFSEQAVPAKSGNTRTEAASEKEKTESQTTSESTTTTMPKRTRSSELSGGERKEKKEEEGKTTSRTVKRPAEQSPVPKEDDALIAKRVRISEDVLMKGEKKERKEKDKKAEEKKEEKEKDKKVEEKKEEKEKDKKVEEKKEEKKDEEKEEKKEGKKVEEKKEEKKIEKKVEKKEEKKVAERNVEKKEEKEEAKKVEVKKEEKKAEKKKEKTEAAKGEKKTEKKVEEKNEERKETKKEEKKMEEEKSDRMLAAQLSSQRTRSESNTVVKKIDTVDGKKEKEKEKKEGKMKEKNETEEKEEEAEKKSKMDKRGFLTLAARTCPYCKEVSSSTNGVDRHIRTSHPQKKDDKIFSCSQCLKQYQTMVGLDNHWNKSPSQMCPNGVLMVDGVSVFAEQKASKKTIKKEKVDVAVEQSSDAPSTSGSTPVIPRSDRKRKAPQIWDPSPSTDSGNVAHH